MEAGRQADKYLFAVDAKWGRFIIYWVYRSCGKLSRGWWGMTALNPLNAKLNHICYLLALLGAHHFLHVSRIRVKSLILRLLMSYIYIYIWSTYS